jgi:hypothetical protein
VHESHGEPENNPLSSGKTNSKMQGLEAYEAHQIFKFLEQH